MSRDDGDPEDADHLGWHVIAGSDLLNLMRRCSQGEDADWVFAELWANAEHWRIGDKE